MAFAFSQVFFVDPTLIQNTTQASLDRVDLFFAQKPQANNNKSGIVNPGVTVFLTTTANSVPQLPNGGSLSQLRWARTEWQDVNVSTDASAPTTFRFDPPVPVPSGQWLAYIVQYDGDEDYLIWKDTVWEQIVGQPNVFSTGASAKNVGPYYDALSDIPILGSNNTSNSLIFSTATTSNSASNLANNAYAAINWQPKVGVTAKFSVYIARYSVGGNTQLSSFVANNLLSNAQILESIGYTLTANGEISYNIPQDRFEYLAYDRINSSPLGVSVGERIFPQLPQYPPGQATPVTLNCTTGANVLVGTGNVNFSTLFNVTANQPNYIIIRSANGAGPGADILNVRQVTAVFSNTQIGIDVPVNFTNAVATFWMAPVATVTQFTSAKFFGTTSDVVMAKKTNANTSLFFSPFSVNSISISANGTGYSNSDSVVIKGHNALAGKVLNAFNATANVVTNANGSLTAIYLANVGSGFSNIANVSYVIANSVGSNSTGTGANLSISIGTNLIAEFSGGNFANSRPIDIDVGQIMPALLISAPSGTYFNTTMRFPYYSVDDIANPYGHTTYCDADNFWDILNVTTFAIHNPSEFTKRRTLPSWSNELFTPYANGASSGGLGGTTNTAIIGSTLQGLTSNASVITVVSFSNSDFTHVATATQASKVTFSRYIINNDYTNENTNYGNAWAKGIETQFNLAANTLAEDLQVYATVYQPANTQVLCFAKIYNTHDNDSFDTKDWTMMKVVSGDGIVSSPTNVNDVFELQWGFQAYPNTVFQINGTVTTTSNSKILTGANTNFSNLISGDLVVIQNNLFSNDYMVAVVNVVTNSTSMTINNPVANLNLVGSGFTVSKIGYKYQAFSNYLNDNVSRYYSSTLTENDGFNSCAIKLVMLSANGLVVPLISDVRAVAVSA